MSAWTIRLLSGSTDYMNGLAGHRILRGMLPSRCAEGSRQVSNPPTDLQIVYKCLILCFEASVGGGGFLGHQEIFARPAMATVPAIQVTGLKCSGDIWPVCVSESTRLNCSCNSHRNQLGEQLLHATLRLHDHTARYTQGAEAGC